MIPQFRRTLDRCDELIKRVGSYELDDFLVSASAQHACVLLAGVLETSIQELLSSYCVRKADPKVGAYSSKRVSGFNNANPQKILDLIRDFDPAWCDELEGFWADRIKDHIGSIVKNRHNIAHGRPNEVSMVRIMEWRKSLGEFVDKLHEITSR